MYTKVFTYTPLKGLLAWTGRELIRIAVCYQISHQLSRAFKLPKLLTDLNPHHIHTVGLVIYSTLQLYAHLFVLYYAS